MLLLGILMGCCNDVAIVASDRLELQQAPEGELNYEVVFSQTGELWGCLTLAPEVDPDCHQARETGEDWLLLVPGIPRQTALWVWESEERIFEQELDWTEYEDRRGGPVCGQDLAWGEASVDLSGL